MAILVAIEHDNQNMHAGTLQVIRAALAYDAVVVACVMGDGCMQVAEQVAQIYGVSKVILVESVAYRHALADVFSAVLSRFMTNFEALVMGATTYGKNLLPRVAAQVGMTAYSEVIDIIDKRTFVRPIYAGNALQTVESLEEKQFFTVRTSAFSPIDTQQEACLIESIPSVPIEKPASTYLSETAVVSTRPDLSRADRVVSGGRGLQTAEQFNALIEPLADVLGAAVGASRAAVDAGFISNDHQVGQTGKVVAPKLYIAIGISGAIQHIAGMKDSKVIVAINKDEDAPIFQWADYGLVGDLFTIVPELIALLHTQE